MGWLIDLSSADRYVPSIEALDISENLTIPYFPGGVTISLVLLPKKAGARSGHRRDQDILPNMQTWVAIERIRDIIEALEPGAQKYFLIEITLRSGKPTERDYYLLNIRQVIDAVDLENSDVDWRSVSWIGVERDRIPRCRLFGICLEGKCFC